MDESQVRGAHVHNLNLSVALSNLQLCDKVTGKYAQGYDPCRDSDQKAVEHIRLRLTFSTITVSRGITGTPESLPCMVATPARNVVQKSGVL